MDKERERPNEGKGTETKRWERGEKKRTPIDVEEESVDDLSQIFGKEIRESNEKKKKMCKSLPHCFFSTIFPLFFFSTILSKSGAIQGCFDGWLNNTVKKKTQCWRALEAPSEFFFFFCK